MSSVALEVVLGVFALVALSLMVVSVFLLFSGGKRSGNPFKGAGEREPDTYVPYIGHASSKVVLLDDGSLLAMLRLEGAGFEMADTSYVNALHSQRNILLRNIASDRIILQTHVVRTLENASVYPKEQCKSQFARELDDGYRQRLLSNRLYRNELFLSVLLRPVSGGRLADGNIMSLFTRRKRGDVNRKASEADLEQIDNVVSTLMYELDAYGARRLGLRKLKGVLFSELAEALRLVLTGEHALVPLVDGHLGGAIYTDRVIVGREAVEIRFPAGSTFAACFGMKEYPAETWPGVMDAILVAPYHCVLTQSFGFLAKQSAQQIMTRKQNQMVTAQDKAASQTEALTEAADLLASNAFVMGDHHLSLTVFANSMDRLRDVGARAKRDLAESGAVVVQEDMALEAAYWAQLPGNMRFRSRPGAVSSRNFAAMASLHNFPGGVNVGHWGAPVAILRTTGGTAYRFHFHAQTETVKDLGNVFVAGPSGSGKTTLMLFLLAMAERQGVTTVLFDKDRGGEILARAVGGTYLVLPSGEPTGLAPLKALDKTPENISFLKDLVKALVMEPGREMLPEDERRLEMGVTEVLDLAVEERSFSELAAYLRQSDPDGAAARLHTWCKGGSLGWVLDNDVDSISLNGSFIGFDTTAVLDDSTTRGPILSYLFHRLGSLLDGDRRVMIGIDEFWKALADEGFRDIVNDKLKTIRKLNGGLMVGTQSPADALRSPISHSVIEQCPTQIMMANSRADARDYRDGLKMTAAEFQAVREDLTVGGRRFLVKQGRGSVACELDLGGLDHLVAVLSARASTVRLMERLIARHGPDPQTWLPAFYEQWRDVVYEGPVAIAA